MDMKKLNIPTLDGPNWGQYVISLQAAAQIINCYDVLREEILTPLPTPHMTCSQNQSLLVRKPLPPTWQHTIL